MDMPRIQQSRVYGTSDIPSLDGGLWNSSAWNQEGDAKRGSQWKEMLRSQGFEDIVGP